MKLTEIDAPDFDLAITLGSGQVFHWDKIDHGFYGTIGDEAVWVEQRGNALQVSRGCADLARIYFALDHPMAEICGSFPDDPVMDAARSYCRGLRIIRQPKWECLAIFICSSMKQVAHIRQISQKLRERFGEVRKIDNGGGASRATRMGKPGRIEEPRDDSNHHTVYTFPSAARLAQSSEKELRRCALGYRAKNLLVTARLVTWGEADLEKWSALSDVDLRAKLCELPGVGAKVANCVMLFAYERLRAFPIDVWIERVLKEKYFPRKRKVTANELRAFVETHFGEHGGYAQQYLFHHARTTSRKSGTARDSSTALRSARNDKEDARTASRKSGKRKGLTRSLPLTRPSASPSMTRLPTSPHSSPSSRTGVSLGMTTKEARTTSRRRKNKRLAGKVLNRRASVLSKIDGVKRPNL